MKPISPQLGFNNNVRHKGRVFHIQTEDSGVKRPHIITHLFMDGGRILKSNKTSYAEFLDEDELAKKIRSLMQEQHKAMFIALRAGKFDHMFEPAADATAADASSAGAPAPASQEVARPAEAAPALAPAAAAPEPTGPAARPADEDARFVRASLPSTTGVSLPPVAPPSEGAVERRAHAVAEAPAEGLAPEAPHASPAPAAAVAPLRPSPAARQPEPPPSAPRASPLAPPPPSASALRPPSRSRLEALGRDATRASPPSRPLPPPAPAPTRPNARPPLSASLDLDLDALERAAEHSGSTSFQLPRDMPPPPSALRRPALMNTSYRSVTPQATHVATTAKSIPPRAPGGPGATPPQGSAPAGAAPSASKYAPSRPAAIFGQTKPQERSSIFGEDLISEKSLDEVILSYLAEDLDGPGKK
jgi:hypothetical protein